MSDIGFVDNSAAILPRITARFVLLSLVAMARGVEVIWEQPGSSVTVDFPYVKWMALMVQPILWSYVRLS